MFYAATHLHVIARRRRRLTQPLQASLTQRGQATYCHSYRGLARRGKDMANKNGRAEHAHDREKLTADERELVRLWRSTDDTGKRAIMAVARSQEGYRKGLKLV